MIQFPEEFDNRIKEQLGDEYDAFIKSYDKPFNNGIRINVLKDTPSEVLKKMNADLRPVPWNQNGFYLENKKQFSKHPYYHAGLYYIQEASAMLPAKLADAHPGEKILDMCAAPGGKSTAVAADLHGEGLLVSNDISNSRAKALLRNLEGFGITNSIVISEYPEKLSRYFPEFFDKVLIDAPCSGEGMFHKEPGMVVNWQQMGPEEYHELQKDILTYGARMLKPGGRLIYSTCTFSQLEDEGSISWFLENHPEFHVMHIEPEEQLNGCLLIDHGRPEWGNGNPELSETLRLWPHHLDGEGHFAAVLVKDGEPYESSVKHENPRPKKGELDAFWDFLSGEGISYPFEKERIVAQNGYVQYQPECFPDLKGLHILRCGWFLGELKKNRFEPSGAFARGLDPALCRQVIDYSSADEQVIRYLKCETLDVDPHLKNGWYLITCDGYPLGWGKVAKGTLKNKYPSGWRLV